MQATIKNSNAQVKVQNQLSDPTEITKGLKQSDGVAPMLFNLTLE